MRDDVTGQTARPLHKFHENIPDEKFPLHRLLCNKLQSAFVQQTTYLRQVNNPEYILETIIIKNYSKYLPNKNKKKEIIGNYFYLV